MADTRCGVHTTSPRSVFPLPRELRDQIYRYLLHHEFVRRGSWDEYHDILKDPPSSDPLNDPLELSRGSSVAHTSKFHPEILGVNSHVKKEALEVLESNDFLVVSHRWEWLTSYKHSCDLPIVTENQKDVAKFNLHVMRIHLDQPLVPRNEFNEPRHWSATKMHSFVMLARDLPELCNILQMQFYLLPSPVNVVSRLIDRPPHKCLIEEPVVSPKKRIGIKVQIMSKDMSKPKPEAVRALLKPFQQLIAGGQRVTFLNCNLLNDEIDILKAQMAPPVVFSGAAAWYMLRTVLHRKQAIDSILLGGGPSPFSTFAPMLVTKYSGILLLQESSYLFRIAGTNYEQYHPSLAVPIALCAITILDVAATMGFLLLRLRQIGQATRTRNVNVNFLRMLLDQLPLELSDVMTPHKAAGIVHPACDWFEIATLFFDKCLNGGEETRFELWLQRFSERLTSLRQAAPEFVGIRNDLDTADYWMHDRRGRAVYKANTAKRLDYHLYDLSVFKLPLSAWVFNSPILGKFKEPDGLDGFIDTNHLQSIREADPSLAARLMGRK